MLHKLSKIKLVFHRKIHYLFFQFLDQLGLKDLQAEMEKMVNRENQALGWSAGWLGIIH
jgi:hypothetical protein